jgi:diguanylate cyclase (GGDEF)-like protein/PAS domain S-box-containing protein
MLGTLHELASIATTPTPDAGDVTRACRLLQEALGAEEAYVIRAGDPDFVKLDCDCTPADYEIKQKGYWLIWRALAANNRFAAGIFDARDRIVSPGNVLRPGRPSTHIATILPGDESNSELLIVRGPWPEGLSAEQIHLFETARPALAHIVSNVLDAERRQRQRRQLETLSAVSKAYVDAQDADGVLTALATALAKASGYDWVMLSLYNDELDLTIDRAINVARHSGTDTAAGVVDERMLSREARAEQRQQTSLFARALRDDPSPIVVPDVFAADLIERPEMRIIAPFMPALQKYYERAHILSVAFFAVMFQERLLGVVNFSSSTRREFQPEDVEFLSALVSQSATIIQGLRLYRKLDESQTELRQNEERFRALVQNATDLISIFDERGVMVYASPAVERVSGYTPDQWEMQRLPELIHPDDRDRAIKAIAAMMSKPGVHAPTTVRIRHADGSYRYIETVANNRLDDPAVRGVIYNSRDVTERLEAELALRQSEERFRSLVQNASDLITVVDPDTSVRYQSPSSRRLLGFAPEELVGTRLSDVLHADDVARVLAAIGDAMRKPEGVATAEARVRHKDGSWRHIELIGTDQCVNSAIGGFVLNIRDVTERKLLEQQLRHQALHDPLTRLANRTRFGDRLEHGLLRAERNRTSVGVLFMDLDNFKSVNDSLGHGAGDVLLTKVAERVQTCLRPGDTVARLGGDEFAILLEDIHDVADATRVADRVFDALQAPFQLESKELVVRASLGIAVSGGAGTGETDADRLLRDADVAMYVAKSRGKGCYEIFQDAMQVSMVERMELLADLQRAVDRREFILHYQPLVVLGSGELIGVEALVRWQHPKRGLLPPLEFISLAEESGAIVSLGAWVLREACRQAAEWHRLYPYAPPWTMSVNVSVKQLQQPTFVADVARVLDETGLEPSSLILEITESVMMQDVSRTIQLLHSFKDLGVRLAIDDFGTGYSSLSYLRQFPFDLLKIDKSFVDDTRQSSSERELTRAIIDLGKTLHMEIVAEGIEHRDQIDRLREMDCDLGQGYYFAEPRASDAIAAMLRAASEREEAA